MFTIHQIDMVSRRSRRGDRTVRIKHVCYTSRSIGDTPERPDDVPLYYRPQQNGLRIKLRSPVRHCGDLDTGIRIHAMSNTRDRLGLRRVRLRNRHGKGHKAGTIARSEVDSILLYCFLQNTYLISQSELSRGWQSLIFDGLVRLVQGCYNA